MPKRGDCTVYQEEIFLLLAFDYLPNSLAGDSVLVGYSVVGITKTAQP